MVMNKSVCSRVFVCVCQVQALAVCISSVLSFQLFVRKVSLTPEPSEMPAIFILAWPSPTIVRAFLSASPLASSALCLISMALCVNAFMFVRRDHAVFARAFRDSAKDSAVCSQPLPAEESQQSYLFPSR